MMQLAWCQVPSTAQISAIINLWRWELWDCGCSWCHSSAGSRPSCDHDWCRPRSGVYRPWWLLWTFDLCFSQTSPFACLPSLWVWLLVCSLQISFLILRACFVAWWWVGVADIRRLLTVETEAEQFFNGVKATHKVYVDVDPHTMEVWDINLERCWGEM